MKHIFIIGLMLCTMSSSFSQKKKDEDATSTDWSSYDFTKHYTLKNGGGKKEFNNNKRIFIANFTIGQNVLANGKQAGSTNFAKMTVGLTGIEKKAFQEMVDKLYNELIAQLKAEGYEIVSDEEVEASEFAKEQHNGKTVFCQRYNETTDYKDQFGNEWLNFYPTNKFVVANYKTVVGTWPTKFGKAINANILSINLGANTVSFDGSRRTGYRGGPSVEGEPALSLFPYCTASNNSGGLAVWGTAVGSKDLSWVGPKGMTKTDQSISVFGSAKGSYVIDVNQELYLKELEAMASGLSKGYVKAILAEIR